MDDELHRRVVVVEKQHPVKARLLRLGAGTGGEARARSAAFSRIRSVIASHLQRRICTGPYAWLLCPSGFGMRCGPASKVNFRSTPFTCQYAPQTGRGKCDFGKGCRWRLRIPLVLEGVGELCRPALHHSYVGARAPIQALSKRQPGNMAAQTQKPGGFPPGLEIVMPGMRRAEADYFAALAVKDFVRLVGLLARSA